MSQTNPLFLRILQSLMNQWNRSNRWNRKCLTNRTIQSYQKSRRILCYRTNPWNHSILCYQKFLQSHSTQLNLRILTFLKFPPSHSILCYQKNL